MNNEKLFSLIMEKKDLVIWVHPLMGRPNIKRYLPYWEEDLTRYAENNSALIITGPDTETRDYNNEWKETVVPFIEEMQKKFSEWIWWEEGFFVQNDDIGKVLEEFSLTPPEYSEYGFLINIPFDNIYVDGLLRFGEQCVYHQRRMLGRWVLAGARIQPWEVTNKNL